MLDIACVMLRLDCETVAIEVWFDMSFELWLLVTSGIRLVTFFLLLTNLVTTRQITDC